MAIAMAKVDAGFEFMEKLDRILLFPTMPTSLRQEKHLRRPAITF